MKKLLISDGEVDELISIMLFSSHDLDIIAEQSREEEIETLQKQKKVVHKWLKYFEHMKVDEAVQEE